MGEPIAISPYPRERAFRLSKLREAEAGRDARRLRGSRLTGGCWTLREWGLLFDNGTELRIRAEDPEVHWRLSSRHDFSTSQGAWHVEAPPAPLKWLLWRELCKVNCSDLIAKRAGACFHDLYVYGGGLFVYFQEHMVLSFFAMRRDNDGTSVLYVNEDD